jgi:glyoxylase-like metal-dependent hydrolase (beta-lactamase superfamily II)
LRCEVSHAFLSGEPLPGGLIPHLISGLECPGETVFHDPAHRAILCADALIGAGEGKVRIPPPAWAERTPEGEQRYKDHFRENLRSLAGLDLDWILTSHGEPVLSQGRAALLEALEAAAWGEA